MLPFTQEQFLQVFARYNEALWPLQWVAWLLGAYACMLVLRSGAGSARAVPAVLALLWLWTGVVYHGLFFAAINRAALLFAALFVLQGLLLAGWAWQGTLRFRNQGARAGLGWALAVESQEVVHTANPGDGRLVIKSGVWPHPVVAVNKGLQGGRSLC
jgi:hypothetical protein